MNATASPTASPTVRHRRRMLAWLTLTALALTLTLITTGTGAFDGRHLLTVLALAGLVVEAERSP